MHAKTYKFTKADIAHAARIPESRVRYAIRTGALEPESLEKLAIYIVKHLLDDECKQPKQ